MTRKENKALYTEINPTNCQSKMMFENEEFCTKLGEDIYDFVKYIIKYD